MAWISDRRVGWAEWKLQNLRFRLIKALAGRDCVAVNLRLYRDGVVGYPPEGRRLFFHNTTVTIDGREFDVGEVLKANAETPT
jgi:hypothetical protein